MSIVLTVMLFQITVPYKNDEGAEREGTMYEKTGGIIYVCMYICIRASKLTGGRRERTTRTSQRLHSRLYRLGNVYPWWFFPCGES